MLKLLRTNLGFTQQQWAQRLGVSVRTVSRWETGKYALRPIEINAMSHQLGIRGSHAFPELVWDEYLRLRGKATCALSYVIGRDKRFPYIAASRPYYESKRQTVRCADCDQQAEHYDHRDYFNQREVEPVCRACNHYRGVALRTFLDHPEYWERFDWTAKPRTGRWVVARNANQEPQQSTMSVK